MGVVSVRRTCVAVHLIYRVLLPVHRHVHPYVEEVLMDVSCQLGRYQGTVLRYVARGNGRVVHHPGQLDFVLTVPSW